MKKLLSLKLNLIIILLIFFVLSFSSCRNDVSYVSDTFFAMDTVIEIKIDSKCDKYDEIFGECRGITKKYEELLSADLPGSDIDRFNCSKNGCEVDPITGKLFLIAKELYEKTGGAFDASLYNSTLLWRESENKQTAPSDEMLSESIRKKGMEYISFDMQTNILSKSFDYIKLDFGAIAKGFAEEAINRFLIESEANYGVLSFGGNISVFGSRPGGSYKISVRDPEASSNAVNISLEEGYISVSGGYERFYEINGQKYCHILDTDTGITCNGNVLSTVVVSKNGALSDALSTALFVIDNSDSVLKLYSDLFGTSNEFEAILIYKEEIICTPGLEDKVELMSNRKIIIQGR